MRKLFPVIFIMYCMSAYTHAQINAGGTIILCNFNEKTDTVRLGGNPTIDIEYKQLEWKCTYTVGNQTYTAEDMLTETDHENPRITKSPLSGDSLMLYLYVTDMDDTILTDSVLVVASTFICIAEIPEFHVNIGDSVEIRPYCESGFKPIRCQWLSDYNIQDNSQVRTWVWPERDTTYRCILTDAVGCTFKYYAEVYVTPLQIDQNKQDQYYVYPNPVNENSFLVLGQENKKKAVYFYDLKGTLHAFMETSGGRVKISELLQDSGTYIYVIKVDDQIKAQDKIVYAR
jgi:hypothetical protein